VLADRAASFADRAVVSGAAIGIQPGVGAQRGTFKGAIDGRFSLTSSLVAQDVTLGERTSAGNVLTDSLHAPRSASIASRGSYRAPPPPPRVPSVTAGKLAVAVARGQTRALDAGAYGSAAVDGTLNLNGGLYLLQSLRLGPDARLVALAPTVVRVATGVTALDRASISLGAGLSAGDLVIESAGVADAQQNGIVLGNDVNSRALLVASSGLSAGDRLTVTGALAARSVRVANDSRVTFESGFACSVDADCNDGRECTTDTCLDTRCAHNPAPACKVAQIGTGFGNSCARVADGRVACWGDNTAGEVGDGTTVQRNTPVFVDGLANVSAISVGSMFTCAIVEPARSLRCWGLDNWGQLGDGGGSSIQPHPVTVPGLSGVLSVSAGYDYTCAVLADQSVACWGYNEYGQLGNGSNTNALSPTAVSLPGPARSVSAGTNGACALLQSGDVMCWGSNASGALGDGTGVDSNLPVAVRGLSGPAIAVSAGSQFACALLASHGVQCWGYGGRGELGTGTPGDSLFAVTVTGLSDAIAISQGSTSEAMCAIRADRSVACWGEHDIGVLDDPGFSWLLPTKVPGLHDVIDISSSDFTHCEALADGSASCWGGNGFGSTGTGLTGLVPFPTPVLFP
jgi:alpha-tubulin suppressor-like RCC1 family protein